MNAKQFTYGCHTYTPVRQITQEEWQEWEKYLSNKNTREPDGYSRQEFYKAVLSAGSEMVDLYESDGLLWCPCANFIMEWRKEDAA